MLGRHLATDTPGLTANWPVDYSLCPACTLTFPFEPQTTCPVCGGAGEVAQRARRRLLEAMQSECDDARAELERDLHKAKGLWVNGDAAPQPPAAGGKS